MRLMKRMRGQPGRLIGPAHCYPENPSRWLGRGNPIATLERRPYSTPRVQSCLHPPNMTCLASCLSEIIGTSGNRVYVNKIMSLGPAPTRVAVRRCPVAPPQATDSCDSLVAAQCSR
jgi:hypothetical protein